MAFILVASGGSYEDAWRRNVVMSKNLAAIEEVKNKKENDRDFIAACQGQLNEFIKEWEKKNPFDSNALEKVVDVPKWPAGIDQRLITKEMRVERETIRSFNLQVTARNREAILAHTKLRWIAEREFCENLGLFNVLDKLVFTEGFISYRLYQEIDVAFEIEEIEEI